MNRQNTLLIVLGAVAALYLLARSEKGRTLVTDVLTSGSRGIRNNNPGNIRKSATRWAGAVPDALQKDAAFVIFSAPEYGIRAMARILKTYLANGVDTVSEIISRWAPPTENDTAAYIAAVSKQTGLSASARVSPADFPKLIAAVIHHENGSQPYSPALIEKGIALS